MFYLRDTENNGTAAYGPQYSVSEHASTARANAKVQAALKEAPVWVETDKRIVMVIWPDGRITPPPTAVVPERAVCTAHEGRVCFCVTCRASRR